MERSSSELVARTCNTRQSFKDNIFWVKESVKSNNEKSIKEIISEIKKIIKDRKHNPLQKLLALDIFHECCMLKNPIFINYSQEKILDRLSILASKRSQDLFTDSNKSLENKSNSDQFLQNLIKYIQIWAMTYPKGKNRDPTLFEKIYNQLKAKIKFPKYEDPTQVINKTTKTVEIRRQSKLNQLNEQEIFEYLENILVIIEDMEDLTTEFAQELLKSVEDSKDNFLQILNRVCNQGDHVVIERVFGINDRINRIEERFNEKKNISRGYHSLMKGQEIRDPQKFYTGNIKFQLDSDDKEILDIKSGKERKPSAKILKKSSHTSQNADDEKIDDDKLNRYDPKYNSVSITERKNSVERNNDKDFIENGGRKSIRNVSQEPSRKTSPDRISHKSEKKIDEIELRDNSPIKIKEVAAVTSIKNEEKKPFNIFDDILDLDINPVPAPTEKNPPNLVPDLFSPFKTNPNPTQEVPDLFSPLKTTSSNPFDILQLFSSPAEFSSPNPIAQSSSPNPPFFTSPLKPDIILPNDELSKLKQALTEKDSQISALLMQVQQLKNKNDILEDTLSKTKSILFSKEKECEELHILKPMPQSELGYFDDLFYTKPIENIKKIESPADNEKFFKDILGSSSGLLYEDSLISITFKLKHRSSKIRLDCQIENRSLIELKNFDLRHVREGFDITISPYKIESLPSANQSSFTITVALTKINSDFPRIIIKFLNNSSTTSITLNLPINFCHFANPINYEVESISQQWEDLVFAGENHKIQLKHAKPLKPETLKLSKYTEIITKDRLNSLSSREFLVFCYMDQMVLALLRSKRKEPEIEIEIRSNDPSLRKHFLSILTETLSYQEY